MKLNSRSSYNLRSASRSTHYGKLCSRCRGLDLEACFKISPEQASGNGTPIIDLYKLGKSARASRCDLCSLFAAVSPKNSRSHPVGESRSPKGVQKLHVRAYNTLKVLKLSSSPSRKSLQKSIALAVVPGKAFKNPSELKPKFHEAILRGLIVPVPSKPSLRPEGLEIWGRLVLPTLTPSCYIEINQFIDDCKKLHKQCERQERLRYPHFRLIDCTSSTRRIVPMTAEMRYIALSYVCGLPMESSAQQHASHNRHQKLPPNIPKTISDAILVVRNLGYQYLWVDLYCIDQEDQNDRISQIDNMDQIYARAEVVIVAAAGKNADADTGLPGVTTVLRTEQPQAFVGGSYYVSTLPHLSTFLAKSKWARRGWTFQEALLSRRCLFFTKAQVYFVCQKGTCCESMMQSSRAELSHCDPGPLTFLNPRLFEPALPPGSFLPSTILPIHSLISEYTIRELTNDSDSLNAFKGILTRFPCHSYWGILIPRSIDREQDVLDADRGFAHGLIWVRLFSPKAAQGSWRLGAPTWSWVSMKGDVVFAMGGIYKGHTARTGPTKRLTVSPKIRCYAKFWVETVSGGLLRLQLLVDRAKNGNWILPASSNFIHIKSETFKIKLRSRGKYGNAQIFARSNRISQKSTSLGRAHMNTSSDWRSLVDNDLYDLEAVLLLGEEDRSVWMLVKQDGDSACRVGIAQFFHREADKIHRGGRFASTTHVAEALKINTQTKTIRLR